MADAFVRQGGFASANFGGNVALDLSDISLNDGIHLLRIKSAKNTETINLGNYVYYRNARKHFN